MGRGRQKAKHMKVARRLKYYSPETDLDALQRELSSGGSNFGADDYSDVDESEDEWADAPWNQETSHSYSGAWDDFKD